MVSWKVNYNENMKHGNEPEPTSRNLGKQKMKNLSWVAGIHHTLNRYYIIYIIYIYRYKCRRSTVSLQYSYVLGSWVGSFPIMKINGLMRRPRRQYHTCHHNIMSSNKRRIQLKTKSAAVLESDQTKEAMKSTQSQVGFENEPGVRKGQ